MAVDSIDTTGTLVLTAGATEYADALVSFAWIMGAALLPPLTAFSFPNRIPTVALLLGLGMLIGPSVPALATEETSIEILRRLGLRASSYSQVTRSI